MARTFAACFVFDGNLALDPALGATASVHSAAVPGLTRLHGACTSVSSTGLAATWATRWWLVAGGFQVTGGISATLASHWGDRHGATGRNPRS